MSEQYEMEEVADLAIKELRELHSGFIDLMKLMKRSSNKYLKSL